MDDLVNNVDPGESAQKLTDCFSAGDRASLEGSFSVAIEHYETALAILDEQKTFDYEKTRDCLNKLINVHSHLENTDKLKYLTNKLSQIENTQSVMMLQASAEFFAGRNEAAKAASAYAKALQTARALRPLNGPLLFELKQAYVEQKKLAHVQDGEPADDTETTSFDDQLLPDEDLETAAVQKNRVMRGVGLLSESKPKSNPLAILDIAKAPIFLLIVSAAFLLSAAQLFVSANVNLTTPTVMPASFTGLQFATCDQERSLKFTGDEHCIMSGPSGAASVNYCLINERLQNTSDLFHGYLRKKEFWLKSQGDDLIDSDNVIFYRPTAAEKVIIDKMWFYAKCAQDQFKESKTYPSSLNKCKRTYQNFGYVNPFTGKADCASLLTQGMQNNVIDFKARGPADRQWRPGAILCLQQDTKHFLVQGFDRQGKPFVSSDPSRYFVIEMEYGKTLTVEPKARKDGTQKELAEDKSAVIYIVSDDRAESVVDALRRLPQIILWVALLMATVCLIFSKRFKRPEQVKTICKRTIYASIIGLLIFYAVAF